MTNQSSGMGETIPGLWRKSMCRLGLHKSLDVIQSYGSAQHIGCPYCRREYGIHHGMQAVIPWTPDLEEIYQFMGYETKAATARWHDYLAIRKGHPIMSIPKERGVHDKAKRLVDLLADAEANHGGLIGPVHLRAANELRLELSRPAQAIKAEEGRE